MNSDEQINSIYFGLGMNLIDKGRWFVQNSYKLNPVVFDRGVILQLLIDNLGLRNDQISLFDEKYYLTSWDKIGKIIDYDLINQMIYHYDFADCNNFAFLFASRASYLYNLNSFGVGVGDVFDLNGNKIGRHCFNIVATKELMGLKLYCHEPMNDLSSLIIKGRDIIVGSWIYKIDWCIFY